eukprot:3057033-Pyramimonas_sp.AAC.1
MRFIGAMEKYYKEIQHESLDTAAYKLLSINGRLPHVRYVPPYMTHRSGPRPEYIPSRLTGVVLALSIYPLASPEWSPP